MAFESLTDRLAGVFKKLKGHGKLTEADIKAAMREVRMALLEADVNYKVAKDFCNKVAERAMGQEVMESLTPAQQVVKIVNEELTNLMGGEEAPRLYIKNKGQTVLMLCGLQGNGKTTHAAKLAKYYLKQGRRPLLVACDIYRPAAIEQLKVVGGQAGAQVFTLDGAKPPEIARRALAHAKDYGNDIVILDTAGRLQIDEVLMDELVDIKQAVPVDETLLVVDAMAGQDAVNVAQTFNEKVGVDGIILTKTDGDTRGGAALSVLAVTGKPIKFQHGRYPQPDRARAGSRRRKGRRGDRPPDDGEQVRYERPAGPVRPDPQDGRRVGHAEHAARRGQHRPGPDRRKGLFADRGHHLLDDQGGAGKALHHQPQAQAPDRRRQRHPGGGRQPSAAPVRDDAEDDEADAQEPQGLCPQAERNAGRDALNQGTNPAAAKAAWL